MNFICGGVGFVVAYVAFTQSKIAMAAGNKNKSRLLMLVSVLAAAFTVINFLAAFFGG